jgi:hypothetical protein
MICACQYCFTGSDKPYRPDQHYSCTLIGSSTLPFFSASHTRSWVPYPTLFAGMSFDHHMHPRLFLTPPPPLFIPRNQSTLSSHEGVKLFKSCVVPASRSCIGLILVALFLDSPRLVVCFASFCLTRQRKFHVTFCYAISDIPQPPSKFSTLSLFLSLVCFLTASTFTA